MKKQQRQLWILLLVLALLVGGYFGLRQYNKAQSEKPEEAEGETVLSVNQADIIKLSYDYEGETYEFEKEGDTWYYAPNHSLNIMQYRIDTMLRNIAQIQASQVIADVEDKSQYGLEEDSRGIRFETADASYEITAGDYNSISSVYYITLSDQEENTVFAVPAMTVNAFDYRLEDLVEEEEEASSTAE